VPSSLTTRPIAREGRTPPFEVLESKLRPPRVTARSVLRTRLVDKLNRGTARPAVMLCAGPGYGKTSALSQWVASPGPRRFAWVSVDRHDNDPIVLLTYIAVALDRLSSIDPGVFEALASPGVSIEATVVPRLGAALASMQAPVVLVLDDLHAVDNPCCIDAVAALVGHLSEGSQLAVSTRDPSVLPLGVLRTRDLIVELGPDDLRMEEVEARGLLSEAGVNASDEAVAELVRRTEGWPTGLYLAALSTAAAGVGAGEIGTLTGNDPFVVDFLRSEFLAQLPPDDLRFLRRTSVLDELSGPLCDAVLAATGSAALLESLERSNRFVVALDRERGWYRCHALVRELLAAELARSEPELLSPLLTRAFDWCMANGRPVAAIDYGQAAGDDDRVATAMERWVMPVFQSGRTATVEQWFEWLDARDGWRRHQAVAVIAAQFYAVLGRPTASDRWADAVEHADHVGRLPDGSASIESWHALLRAFRCTGGVVAMREDAALAVRTLGSASIWLPSAVLLLWLGEMLTGNTDEADDRFADVADEAADLGAPDMLPVALAERALLAVEREQWARADELAERAVWAARQPCREDASYKAART